ncbi:MAG: sugar phosphate nucleotidyltransferase, partial [Burkholderiales bacterium]
DPVLVVTPADQTVTDAKAFTDAMREAIRQAADGAIVILGITPSAPETGYGYVQAHVNSGQAFMQVMRFVEKPTAEIAQQYLDEGGYYWNAGMFVLRASVWIKALQSFRPDILQATNLSWDKRTEDANLA